MKKNTDAVKIDTEIEFNHLFEFTQTRWDGFDKNNMRDIMHAAWVQGLKASKNFIDQYEVSNIVHEWYKDRNNKKNWKLENPDYLHCIHNDAINGIISTLSFSTSHLRDAAVKNWDFSNEVKKTENLVKDLVENKKSIRPKGYAKLAKNYNDFDGQHEYANNQQAKDEAEFKGIDSGTAGASGFHLRIALPYIMYDDKCQGRPPFYMLIGSVFAHAMFVTEKNNSLETVTELKRIKEELSAPEYWSQIQYDVNINTNNRFIKAMLLQHKPQELSIEEFENTLKETINHIKEYEKLTPEQKKERKAKRDEEFMKMIDDIKLGVNDIENDRKRDKEIESMLAILNLDTTKKSSFKPK